MPKIMGKIMPIMMTPENMEKMVKMPEKMLPKMLENENIRKIMPEMMNKVMPQCSEIMLPIVEKEKRIAFVSKIIKQGYAGMSAKEKEDFLAKVIEKTKI
jgi:hypothetical protein